MAFDGCFLYKTVNELKEAIDSHIDKIYQPSKDELVFLLRKKGFAKRLLITIKSGSARIHFTENKYENPVVPPNFCMLLRKYLSAARLINVKQPELERVAELVFSATNEMGDLTEISLVCELIGNQANAILIKDGRILDALRHSDVETAKRLILPGATYELPPTQEKLDPLNCDILKVSNELCEFDDISKSLLNTFLGFSPLICRELEHRIACDNASGTSTADLLYKNIKTLLFELVSGNKVFVLYSPDGKPLDFSFTNITQYGTGYKCVEFGSCSSLLDAFYTAKDTAARIQLAAHDIIRLVNNLRSRTEKKLALRLTELKKCENRETLRIYGELLKANLYTLENGSRYAEVPNYYDENMTTVKIPLNPALSPSRNAEKYFKDYKKTYSAEQTLTQLTKEDQNELVYLDSVIDSISRCETLAELAEIRQELTSSGYIRNTVSAKKQKPVQNSFKEYTSPEGYRIVVGKNNLQNDYITTKLASKNDMWFHVKNIPGSHVVVFSSGGELSDETLMLAARLAAENSKASTSAQVPVDYTLIKNVKKPSGAKPGMVIYTTNKTIFVTPQ